MTPETKKRIHLIYGILVSVAAVVAGICFIAACCNIYYTGIANDVPQIYTRDIVAENFAKICVPVYICLALVLGGIVLNIALPQEKKRSKPEKNVALMLSRLQNTTNLDACTPALRKQILSQRTSRRIHSILSAALLAIGSVVFLIYACNAGHWGANSTPSMVSAMYWMISCLALPLLYILFTAYFCRNSRGKELEFMKQANKEAPKAAATASVKCAKRYPMGAVQLAVIAIAVVLVILGVCNDGTADILTKAVNICTECVGLG